MGRDVTLLRRLDTTPIMCRGPLLGERGRTYTRSPYLGAHVARERHKKRAGRPNEKPSDPSRRAGDEAQTHTPGEAALHPSTTGRA